VPAVPEGCVFIAEVDSACRQIWLDLDSEVLVLPPVFSLGTGCVGHESTAILQVACAPK